ncbi:hypothetical protein BWGOE4_46340 [Bacillus mycoides]|uniref:hypothetical protein n=1 Tax=Bacillus cereus group TaxID=86661 RepID=UPI000863EB52|nr:hypothetical protein [Bacillus mycoides]MBJ8068801.1 hypothetical protein [Bacillus cereus]MBJ8185996.1 hypothetical protein [Bacillus cereus]OFD37894.1 hypothetical protein BWGOE2_46230 [Bacillus mycoides]OFD42096.1 hypothetical protein BWGOE1_46140 [Bacillus mycoides]OFD54143.1 hypothetical protein BWGOE4_46340 [Bacillus mycoides]
MGRKSRKRKQVRKQKYIKTKQEQDIPLSKKIAIIIGRTFRYISMAIYVILCAYSFEVFYSFGITPNIIESILDVIIFTIELVLFFILFYKVWPSHESNKDKKRNKRKKSSQASSSSSGLGDYSSSDCSSSSDGGGDCGGGGD